MGDDDWGMDLGGVEGMWSGSLIGQGEVWNFPPPWLEGDVAVLLSRRIGLL